jgi:hypothetical protein
MRVHGVFSPTSVYPRLAMIGCGRPGRVAVRLLSGSAALDEGIEPVGGFSPWRGSLYVSIVSSYGFGEPVVGREGLNAGDGGCGIGRRICELCESGEPLAWARTAWSAVRRNEGGGGGLASGDIRASGAGETSCEERAEPAVEREEVDILDRERELVVAVELATALGLADVEPVGRCP